MNRRLLLAAGLVAAMIAASRPSPGKPAPDPATAEAAARLAQILAKHPDAGQRRQDAAALAAILHSCAEIMDIDAARQPPRLTTGRHLADLRAACREYSLGAFRFSDRYPDLADYYRAEFTKRVGTNPAALTAKDRTAWRQAFEDLAAAAALATP